MSDLASVLTRFAGMRVLVIGGTLFIGRELVSALVKAGHEVWVLHRKPKHALGKKVGNIMADRNDPASLKAAEVELVVTVVGVDDTSLQPVHARQTYEDSEIVWGARHADILHEDPDGTLTLDLRRFHEVVPTTPTADFPYP